jgi:predicted MFS family arabinose efflux permease
VLALSVRRRGRAADRSSILSVMREVLKLPAFRRLLVSAILNELALAIAAVALALLVYGRTGSAIGATAFFLCAEFAPAFGSPLLVTRLDQRSARQVLASLYLSEAIVYLGLALFVRHLAVAAVLLLVLINGSVAVAARVLARTAWTTVTTASGLVRDANAVVNAVASVCFLVGPALGGALVTLGGTRLALFVDSGALAVCLVTVATAAGLPPAVSERAPVAGRLRAAVAYARGQVVIRRLLTLQALAMLFFTMSIPVEVVLVERTLHSGAGGYGLLLSVWGGGAIVGSAVYARWRKLASRRLITLGTCLLGLGFVPMAAAPNLSVAMAGAAVAGLGNGIQIVAARTVLQETTPARWMALILTVNESMFQAVPGLGITLGGAIAAVAGPRAALAAGAAGTLAIALVMWSRLAFLDVLPSSPAATPDRQVAEEALPEVARPA